MLVCSPTKKSTLINNKIIILPKSAELYLCGVQNMLRKGLLEIETVQIPQSPTTNIVSFVLKTHKICLENSD